MKLKLKISNKHKALLKLHSTKIIAAIAIVLLILLGLNYKRTMNADNSTARGAFWARQWCSYSGAIGGGRGAAIGAGAGLVSGAAIGSSRSSHSDVSPETKRLNNLYKQIDKKQARLDKLNKRIAQAKEHKRHHMMNQAERYKREIMDLQEQANAIAHPKRKTITKIILK